MHYFIKVDAEIALESCEDAKHCAAILARGFRKVEPAEYSAWWSEKDRRRVELREENMRERGQPAPPPVRAEPGPAIERVYPSSFKH